MKKYIKPSIEVISIDTPSPLMVSAIDEVGGQQRSKQNFSDGNDTDDCWTY